MLRLCTKCHKVFRHHKNNVRYLIDCPDGSCNGDAFKIDELMIPIIRHLHDNDIQTIWCCSGHLYEDELKTYIYIKLRIPCEDGYNKIFSDLVDTIEDSIFTVKYEPIKLATSIWVPSKAVPAICIRLTDHTPGNFENLLNCVCQLKELFENPLILSKLKLIC
ncbi:MAG: hypothetical protein GY804_08865 [Alphaproteobacteria bacterium]|nr:hypothetical protein [Alphaproteobacteria bacterium]